MFVRTAIESGFSRVDMIRGANKKEWLVVRDPKDAEKTLIVANGHLFKMRDVLVRERISAALQALGWTEQAARVQSNVFSPDIDGDWRTFLRKHKTWKTDGGHLIGLADAEIKFVAKETAPDVGGISGTTTTSATTGL